MGVIQTIVLISGVAFFGASYAAICLAIARSLGIIPRKCRDEDVLAQRMADEMKAKLAINVTKGPWTGLSFRELIQLLRGEVDELEACFSGERVIDPKNVWPEAADVANYAAMIADNAASMAK